VKIGVPSIVACDTEEEKATNKESKKRYYKALFIIHQCVDADNFEKVGDFNLQSKPETFLKNLLEVMRR
jgi:hypothetical protein